MNINRREFGTLVGAAAGSLALGAEQMDTSAAVFPYGTHVYREPSLPLEQIRADLPVLKRLGFTMIKGQESWSADEVKEGEIQLDRVARVVSDARQNGLLVYFGVTMEQAPAWLWRKYPDSMMRFENGQTWIDPTQYLLPDDGKPGPCWNHPGARAAAERFIEAVGREIGKYDNILVWNVWQEIGLGFDAKGTRVCFCPNTLAAFRNWCRDKYKSLDALNTTWRTHYGDWQEVDPPRNFTKVPSGVDWRYFMDNVYEGEALKWKAAAFRRGDPKKRKILAHSANAHYGGTEDWTFARSGLDVYGSSCYPGWGELQLPGVTSEQRLKTSDAPYLQALDNALKWDYMRSACVNGELWTAELQGGRASGGLAPGRVPDPGDIRRWVMGALAGGVRGICFWNHRSEIFWDEAYGFGLLELEGDSTARAEEAGRIARAVNEKVPELFAHGSVPRSSVAIVADEPMWNFVACSGEPVRSHFLAAVRGVHRQLWESAIPVDFINGADIREGQYKALILPFPISMSDELTGRVSKFVESGGTLISGAAPGRFSAQGFGTAGEMPAPLRKLFGVRQKTLLNLGDAKVQLEGEGGPVTGEFYAQYLECVTAKPLLTVAGEVSATVNRYGKGTAVLIGTLFGDAGNGKFVAQLVKQAGVEPDRIGECVRRRRVHGEQEAWFLFNPSREEIAQDVPIAPHQTARALLSDGTASNGAISVKIPALNFECVLLS